jgi:hypothetical protein
VTYDTITISPGLRFRTAMILAIIADALQIVVFPIFVAGAASPADDVLDFAVGAVLVYLLGWHWEFLPSFFAKLVPGVDLVPFWTMAVANVYRKSKRIAVGTEESREQHPALRDPQPSVSRGLPVILDPDNYDLWLDPGMNNVAAASELLKPCDARLMRSFPVSTRINHVANDDAECSVPVELDQIQNTLFT